MGSANRARVAVAGPMALLGATVGMALAAALSNWAQWPMFVVIAILPAALCLWLAPNPRAWIGALLVVATLVVSLGVAAAVVLLLVPLFEIAGVGISGAGVYTLLWGPTIVVLLGSFVARRGRVVPCMDPGSYGGSPLRRASSGLNRSPTC